MHHDMFGKIVEMEDFKPEHTHTHINAHISNKWALSVWDTEAKAPQTYHKKAPNKNCDTLHRNHFYMFSLL